jgi:hypothetical protein
LFHVGERARVVIFLGKGRQAELGATQPELDTGEEKRAYWMVKILQVPLHERTSSSMGIQQHF